MRQSPERFGWGHSCHGKGCSLSLLCRAHGVPVLRTARKLLETLDSHLRKMVQRKPSALEWTSSNPRSTVLKASHTSWRFHTYRCAFHVVLHLPMFLPRRSLRDVLRVTWGQHSFLRSDGTYVQEPWRLHGKTWQLQYVLAGCGKFFMKNV